MPYIIILAPFQDEGDLIVRTCSFEPLIGKRVREVILTWLSHHTLEDKDLEGAPYVLSALRRFQRNELSVSKAANEVELNDLKACVKSLADRFEEIFLPRIEIYAMSTNGATLWLRSESIIPIGEEDD